METEKSSPTKKAKDVIAVLEKRIERLEYTIAMMAHYTGTNKVILDCDLTPWEPEAKHLRRG